MKKKSLSVKKISHRNLNKVLSKKFLKSIFDKFEQKLNKNERYLVAVSGGPDSLALAFFCQCYQKKYNTRFIFCTVDHGLRPESSKESKKVVKILSKINIPCKILKWKGVKPSKNIQAIARHNRYALLEKQCKINKINNILLAHQKDDVNENFFIRLTRGSGLKGLVSLDENVEINRINYLRPFLDLTKKKLESVSLEVFKTFINDPSNLDEKFKRIRLRKLINSLNSEGLDKNKIDLTIQNLKKADRALEYYTSKNLDENSIIFYDKKATLKKDFFYQPNEVILRSLNVLMRKIGNKYYPPRAKSTYSLINELKSQSSVKNTTLGGCLFKKINETIIISKETG